jgi:hypothetical protein
MGANYVEMVHPHDAARRIVLSAEPPHPTFGRALAIRYGLLGLDLEKGVVVRARLRGLWVPDADLDEVVRSAFRQFVDLPPPLGT